MRLIAFGLIALSACAPKGVEFEVVAPNLNATERIYVAGSWNGWQPDGLALEHVGGERWAGRSRVPNGTHEFKFTLGTWEREGLKPNGFQRDNDLLEVMDGRAEVRDTVWGWSNGPAPKEPQGQLTGRVDTLGTWSPPGLLPRLVTAWVPPSDSVHEFVILHDGRNVFDPASANFGVDWGVDDTLMTWAPELGVLAVAIDCTDDRSTDYGPGPEGRAYVTWLAEEVVPAVRAQYGLDPRTPVTVAGASMGGLISAIALIEHPDVFDAAICMSPAFSYRDFSYPELLEGREWSENIGPMWIDNGTVGLEAQLQAGVDEMAEYLSAQTATFTFQVYPEGRHFEKDWGERFGEAFRWVQQHR
jgi:predicted alpha/beta superfamily hydrolase